MANPDDEATAQMVARLEASGTIRSPRVAEAMRRVPRAAFLPSGQAADAHADAPQPIGEGQTISAPHMVAMMGEALDAAPGQRVLDVGTGSGYHAAVLAHLVAPDGEVVTIERLPALADAARERLAALHLPARVEVVTADGSRGLPGRAPFDRISVAAGAPDVPTPLVAQLAPGGRLVVPVGPLQTQHLMLVTKDARGLVVSRSLGPVRFVPLVGEHGWAG